MIRSFWCSFIKLHVTKLRLLRTYAGVEDPYKILGLHPGASAEEVRAAYLKAAIQTHPDSASTSQAGVAEEAFRRVSEAYQRLRSRQRAQQTGKAANNSRSFAPGASTGLNGRPPFSTVSDEQAEQLFQAAFSGRGVDQMLDEELARFNIKPGVHAAAVKEGIYARLLRAAQAASQLPGQDGHAQRFATKIDDWPRLEVQRETLVGDDGLRRLRISEERS
ncbi:unnamed protein product [Durusdinium trenchii]|uniref:J domain-containing protein n=1 Tax=Durusdinium trenchii TaxID=1381693 RepID=A0ABP0P6W8_9DINO